MTNRIGHVVNWSKFLSIEPFTDIGEIVKTHQSRRLFLRAGITLPAVALVSSGRLDSASQETSSTPKSQTSGKRGQKDSGKGKVKLEVLNPRGVLHSVPITGLSKSRVKDLAGKRIALISEKPDAVLFFDAMQELFKNKYPGVTFKRFSSPTPIHQENSAEIAEQCDVWLEGVKTSGSSMVDIGVKLEKLGIPGVAFSVDGLINQRRRLAEANGLPALRILSVPAETFFACEMLMDKIKPIAASMFDATVQALTSPLTDAEKNPKAFSYDYGAATFAGDDFADANEKYQQYCIDNEIGDGLPLTPPTLEAVRRMLAGTSRSPKEELGLMTPRNGMATIEKIAINSVMAGARPEYLPVIIAAVEGLLDPSFNLYHIQTGTLNSKVLIWVNGPIAKEIGMNSGQGFLGHGFRANSAIGRAVSLCMINIGWSLISAESGMLGQPARYCNLTFAENEKDSPWESFAVEHGFKPEDSTVTLEECTSENRLGPGGGMIPQTLESDMDALAAMIASGGPLAPRPSSGSAMPAMMLGNMSFAQIINSRYCEIAMHPTFARQLKAAGYSKQKVAQWLCDKYRISWDTLGQVQKDQLKAEAAAGRIPGLTLDDCKAGGTVPTFNPKHIAIIVAGGMVGQTAAFYGGGSTMITADNPNVPQVDFMTKLIRGATRTKAGR